MSSLFESREGLALAPHRYELNGVNPLQNVSEIDPNNIEQIESILRTTLAWTTEILTPQFEEKYGKTYEPPTLNISIDGNTVSASGGNPSTDGPLYDSEDKTVYFDPRFFGEKLKELDPHIWAITIAYCIAHEVGHHVQNLLNDHPQFNEDELQFEVPEEQQNLLIVAKELQADCIAGMLIHAKNEKDKGTVDADDPAKMEEDASAIGDDKILRHNHMPNIPWIKTHGDGDLRRKSVEKGFTLDNIFQVPPIREFFEIGKEIYKDWWNKAFNPGPLAAKAA